MNSPTLTRLRPTGRAPPGPTSDKVELSLGGMTCASCAARIEKRLNKLDGVEASVNYALERASVTFSPTVSTSDLVSAVESIGYGRPSSVTLQPSTADRQRRGPGAGTRVAQPATPPLASRGSSPCRCSSSPWSRRCSSTAGSGCRWRWPARSCLGRMALPPRGVVEPAPRRSVDGHVDLAGHARRLRLVVVGPVPRRGRRSSDAHVVRHHSIGGWRHQRDLPRGSDHRGDLHPRRPLLREPRQAHAPVPPCERCSNSAPRTSPFCGTVSRCASQSSSSQSATSS